MAKETTTADPIPPISSPNTQDYSVSDDEILDNFADGPDPNDDGVPLGVGGEKGKQAEPASSTLEADIVNGTTTQSDETTPSESASEAPPVQEPVGETGPEKSPEPIDSDEPEIPAMLLQMAGYADADAAKADGLGTPEALNAFIRGRGQLLSSQPAEPTGHSTPDGYPYPKAEKTPPAPARTEPEPASEFKPFELSEDDVNVLDEQLVDVVKRMNEHNQRQFDDLRNSQLSREQQSAEQQVEEEVHQFDKAVQNLGEDWQDVFGEGDMTTLLNKGQTDPSARLAAEYRRELFQTVQTVRDVNAQRGFEPMDFQREIGFGLMQRFPDKFQQTVSSNSSSNSSNGNTQKRTSLNRPSQRRSSPTSQDQLLGTLAKKFPSAGFTATDPDDFDGEI